MGYIYMLTSPNGKIYIGQTTRPIHKRLGEHKKGKIGCRAIYSAIQKYGWENFKKDWYECPDEDLNFDEDLLVSEMRTLSPKGYNLKDGGGNHGKHSDESRLKMSKAQKGKKLSKETKQKISKERLGEKHHNAKRVCRYALDGTFIDSFGSIGEAGRHLNKTDGSIIAKCARGERKTAYNYKWSYMLNIFI
jgi:group I intron endonuclease